MNALANPNIKTIENLYAAYLRGDIQSILDGLAPNVRWTSNLDPIVPWAGEFQGRVPEFFKAIEQNCEVLGFEPGEYIAEGDTVVSIGTFSCKSNKTGKSGTTRWIFVWKLKDGVITSYEQFSDPRLAEVFRP